MTYDLIIIGGGPAGSGAAVYAARKKLKTLFITREFGGQSVVSDGIENWIGTIKIAGAELAKSLEDHVEAYKGDVVEVKKGLEVVKVSKDGDIITITDSTGATYESRALLITTGSARRKLEAVNADIFEHKGLTYCATCDGPLFSDQNVAVIGGGNAAFESAAQLLAYCSHVTLIHRSDKFRADEVTVEKLKQHPNFSIITEAKIKEIHGDMFVSGLTYEDKSGVEQKLDVGGIFVEIGQIPNTGLLKDISEIDEYGKIKIDPWTGKTTTKGIWAAGDCTNIKYHQNNIAVGEAVKALEDIYSTLNTQ